VQKDRAVDVADLPQRFDQRSNVVPIDRSDVGEAELFPDHRVIDEFLDRVFPPLADLDQQFALRQALGEADDFVFGLVVAAVGADTVEIAGDGADVRGDRHLVVVEDDQEGQIEDAGVVQPFERHPAGQCPVADDGDDAAVAFAFLMKRFGDAERRRNRGRSVAGAEGVVLAFVA
jgi:hypothetical protein